MLSRPMTLMIASFKVSSWWIDRANFHTWTLKAKWLSPTTILISRLKRLRKTFTSICEKMVISTWTMTSQSWRMTMMRSMKTKLLRLASSRRKSLMPKKSKSSRMVEHQTYPIACSPMSWSLNSIANLGRATDPSSNRLAESIIDCWTQIAPNSQSPVQSTSIHLVAEYMGSWM